MHNRTRFAEFVRHIYVYFGLDGAFHTIGQLRLPTDKSPCISLELQTDWRSWVWGRGRHRGYPAAQLWADDHQSESADRPDNAANGGVRAVTGDVRPTEPTEPTEPSRAERSGEPRAAAQWQSTPAAGGRGAESRRSGEAVQWSEPRASRQTHAQGEYRWLYVRGRNRRNISPGGGLSSTFPSTTQNSDIIMEWIIQSSRYRTNKGRQNNVQLIQ